MIGCSEQLDERALAARCAQFMLRRFSSDGRELVHAFDKHQDNIFAFSTSKKSKAGVAAQRAIYDVDFQDVPMTLEPALSSLETKAAEVTGSLRESSRLKLVPLIVMKRRLFFRAADKD